MNILGNSVKDIDDLFENLAIRMSGPNYCVDFEVRIFQYGQEVQFTINTLKKLYENHKYISEDPVKGLINEVNFEQVQNQINRNFKFDPNRKEWEVDQETCKQRLNSFWEIINSHFTLPPTHCFEHKPEHDSFFGGWVMWVFCYVLLNDNTKEGIVIASQAYD